MPFKKGQSGFKGRHHSEKSKAIFSVNSKGNKHRFGIPQSDEAKKKISQYMKGRRHQNRALTNQRILDECAELERQGFRAVPTGGHVIPDIVAIKDNKIYAVEVEYGKPNYNKYSGKEGKYFDDIIWILRKKLV